MYRIVFVMFVLAACSTGQKKKTIANKVIHETLVDGEKVNDTDLISAEAGKDFYYVVYIEHNRQSPSYKAVLDFKPDSNEKSDYQENYKVAKEYTPAKFKKYDLSDLPKEWLPLYLHKGKYYLYAPSDWGNLGRRVLTDSTIVYWPMDGPTPFPVMALKKPNKDTYNFKLHSAYDTTTSQLIIHIIEPKNKIAVWENQGQKGPYRYSLFVPRQNAKNFDMVVSYCKTSKTAEFQFDNIDYATLLKGIK